jgi:hypothetical protein
MLPDGGARSATSRWRCCARCHRVLIPEALALGRMHQVEQLLEDK